MCYFLKKAFIKEGVRTGSCEINCTSLHQAKVQELYRLDRLLQEESGTLQSLQQDKVRAVLDYCEALLYGMGV
jgi:hypothetical protein